MNDKEIMGVDASTEQKIKDAAKTMFVKKGYAATKTRDIAEHAGINLALVNYYFRSKENLFKQIMMESLQGFFGHIKGILNDSESNLEEKLNSLSENYIDYIIHQPDIPIFILSELRSNPQKFVINITGALKFQDTSIYKQMQAEIGEEKMAQIQPVHMLINLLSLIIFPFISKPMIQKINDMSDSKFDGLMEERKKLIPVWIMQMMR